MQVNVQDKIILIKYITGVLLPMSRSNLGGCTIIYLCMLLVTGTPRFGIGYKDEL